MDADGFECNECGEVYEDATCPRHGGDFGAPVSITPCSVEDCDDGAHHFGLNAHIAVVED